MALSRGHVVALRRGDIGVIWYASTTDVWIVPIWGRNGPPRHRSEVEIESVSDIGSCGITIRYPVARCHLAYKVAISALTKITPCGVAPAALLARIIQAVKTEVRTQVLENRLHFNPDASVAP